VLLQQKGLINHALLQLGLIERPLPMIYNRIGVIVGMTHILLPFMILPLYSVLTRIDPSYASAAASLGAGPVRNFLRVYLPLSLPGVLTGTVLVFVVGLGYYITPALLGGPGDTMIAQLIEAQVAEFGRWGLAGALALILLLGTSVTFVLVQRTLATAR
jgi:putative spermidine/putrescine transport system permease protein